MTISNEGEGIFLADLVAEIYLKMKEVGDGDALDLTALTLQYFGRYLIEPEEDEDVPF